MKNYILRSTLFICNLSLTFVLFPMFEFEEEDTIIQEIVSAIKQNDQKELQSWAKAVNPEMLNFPDSNGITLLGHAIDVGDVCVVDTLIKQSADVNKETNGKSPLMLAVQKGNKEIVRSLLLARATDSDHYELFHHAIKAKSVDIVQLLVRQGFDINARAADSSFPLIDAVLTRHAELIETCIRLGANPLLYDYEGRQVIQLLQECQNSPEKAQKILGNEYEIEDIIEDQEEFQKISDEEIIKLLETITPKWLGYAEHLKARKSIAQKLNILPLKDALELFERYDRKNQKEVLPFLPIALYEKTKQSQLRKSPTVEPELSERDRFGIYNSYGNNSYGCWLQ